MRTQVFQGQLGPETPASPSPPPPRPNHWQGLYCQTTCPGAWKPTVDIANAMVSDGAESPTQACFVPKLRLPDLVNKTIGYVTEFEFQMNNLGGGISVSHAIFGTHLP